MISLILLFTKSWIDINYITDQELLWELFNIFSNTFILANESDIGVGTFVLFKTAIENKSPCKVYWSHNSNEISSSLSPYWWIILHSLSCGALNGISISILPFVRQYRIADINWFDETLDLPNIKKWVHNFINSEMFHDIMKKNKLWEINDPMIFL